MVGRESAADLEAEMGRRVRKTFPNAKAVRLFRMDGWRIPIPPKLQPAPRGTLPSDCVLVLLAHRKAGPTLHFWNPLDHECLARNRATLTKAGFKVMVGCVRFSGNRPFPFHAVDKLLGAAQAKLRA